MGEILNAEISRAIDGKPFANPRIPAKIRRRLIAQDWAVEVAGQSSDRFGVYTVKLLALTFLGNFLYCTSCVDESDEMLTQQTGQT
jgi:hypothetical protein